MNECFYVYSRHVDFSGVCVKIARGVKLGGVIHRFLD